MFSHSFPTPNGLHKYESQLHLYEGRLCVTQATEQQRFTITSLQVPTLALQAFVKLPELDYHNDEAGAAAAAAAAAAAVTTWLTTGSGQAATKLCGSC